ncbi:hypothetical protein [Legionella cardiaca]|uniref:EF-hand domain-containing protein n=1 Tax=Legionella cardiaca TaxID=1071983 RepID=A0ABY8AUG4_9GAMM|nr:hypothetical protein [Legionella cardiaca]WED43396.1 hypothetical protein PXX05_01080 [Legionella cardiaca]
MWYTDLMQPLVAKITIAQQEQAKSFLKKLFSGLRNDVHKEKLPVGMLLGVIEKAYEKFQSSEDGAVNLAEFSQYVLGLAIIYSKVNEDSAFWNADFIDLCRSLTKDLNLAGDIAQVSKDIATGRKKFTTKGSISNEDKAINYLLNQLERRVFHELQFQADVNLSKIKGLFAKYPSAIPSFSEYCCDLDVTESPEFAAFLIDLENPDDTHELIKKMEEFGQRECDVEKRAEFLRFLADLRLKWGSILKESAKVNKNSTLIQEMKIKFKQQLVNETKNFILEQSSWAIMSKFANVFSAEIVLKPITMEINARIIEFYEQDLTVALNGMMAFHALYKDLQSADFLRQWQELYYKSLQLNGDKEEVMSQKAKLQSQIEDTVEPILLGNDSTIALKRIFYSKFKSFVLFPSLIERLSQQLTDFDNLPISQGIKEIERVGNTLIGVKGIAAKKLAVDLQKQWEALYFEVQKSDRDEEKIKGMKKQFHDSLHSQDDLMNTHREIWKPILINIGLALTVFGAVAIIGKTLYSGIKDNKLSFNSCLFFAKTATQQHIEELDKNLAPIAAPAA